MIRARIEGLVRSWTSDNGYPPDSDYQRGYMAACAECARELSEILAEEEGGWTEGMETSPEWDDEVTKIWVYGGRYSVPTIEYADRSRFTMSYVSRHPTHWAPCEPPPLLEPPPGARP